MYKLEKEIKLYKNQFEDFVLEIYKEHRMERLSMDLDAILSRVKYMVKCNKDLDRIDDLRGEFVIKALELRNLFGELLYNFFVDIIGLGETGSLDNIIDILSQDVKIDNVYITFKVLLISDSMDYLAFVDNQIEDNEVYNMFPNNFFRFYVDSYNDGVAKAYPKLFESGETSVVGEGNDHDVYCHNFTFQITEDCSLCCTYCYQTDKTKMTMTFDTAKKFIDDLLDDKYGYINRFNSPAIIIEFIGGEAFLEIKLLRKIYEYFLDRCYDLDHPWFSLHRISICSNGLSYFDEDVQNLFKDYSQNISFNISIDGNKKLHDSCRIQPNGEGSYDICMDALNHYNQHYTPERNSKMTLAPQNMEYLFESVKDFIDNGMQTINLNCVFEEGWNNETALLEYNELKKLADYILENDLENLYISIFNERQEDIQDESFDGMSCGGTGKMLALRPNGQFYPCIRFMPTSVGEDAPDLCMGSVQDGMHGRDSDSEVLRLLDSCSRRSSMNDMCYECPIGNSCFCCVGLSHTIHHTPNKNVTFVCIQKIAEALANVYYWNNLLLKCPQYDLPVRKNNVPKSWALTVIDDDEWDHLQLLEMAAMAKKLEREMN